MDVERLGLEESNLGTSSKNPGGLYGPDGVAYAPWMIGKISEGPSKKRVSTKTEAELKFEYDGRGQVPISSSQARIWHAPPCTFFLLRAFYAHTSPLALPPSTAAWSVLSPFRPRRHLDGASPPACPPTHPPARHHRATHPLSPTNAHGGAAQACRRAQPSGDPFAQRLAISSLFSSLHLPLSLAISWQARVSSPSGVPSSAGVGGRGRRRAQLGARR